jgi:very-short-patch-repair endonuclease
MCFPKKLCDEDECKICFERTFASQEKSKFWSDKNENIKPHNIAKYSSKKFWFDCDKKECGHSFYSSIANITNLGRWCPYCSNQKLCNEKNCIICFEKSFASQEKSKFWSDKNEKQPRELLKSSPKKYWFECDKKEECGHIFYISLNKISTSKRWCAFCKNKKLCEKEDCKSCFEKSFASHEKSKFWSDKNENIKPRNLFKGSSTNKYWFDCNKCFHKFSMSLSSITSKNTWCTVCKNKTEKKLFNKLKENYPELEYQFKIEWCKNIETKRLLPYDFVLKEHKIIIELDGRQHFEQVSNWTSPEETLKRDKYKEECANENGYSMIRILQDDVWNDKYEWLEEIDTNIKDIIKNKTLKNIYMSKKEEYKNIFYKKNNNDNDIM